jgi:hypothetical protein
MATEGPGSSRIILVDRRTGTVAPVDPPEPALDELRVTRATAAPAPAPLPTFAPPVLREREQERQRTSERAAVSTGASAWTVRRLVNGAVFSGLATVFGGLIFHKNFQLFGASNRPLLSLGFGLFVVGMVIFSLSLIGLAAAAVRSIVAGQGWPAAAILMLAPIVPLVLLNMIGLVPVAVPSLFVIIVAGGFTLALKR